MEGKVRAALYARVSTSDGRQEVENQLSELRRLAATQGWVIAGEYIDHESGGSSDRAEFRRMFVDGAGSISFCFGRWIDSPAKALLKRSSI
jgi:predicted site-specific integrase-resolvase